MKICLVCSAGGHIVEMGKLKSAFETEDVFLITHRDKVLNWSEPLNKIYCIENVLVGKAHYSRVIKLFLFIIYIIHVTLNEFILLLKEKPELIVSTGSAIAVPIFYMGKSMGIRTLFVESICRVKTLSLSGKLVYRIADDFLVQWQDLTHVYNKAKYVGNILPTKITENKFEPAKEYAIFLMIGTAPFPRLVEKIDEIAGKLKEKVIMQIGRTNYKPKNADYFTFVDDFSKIQHLCRNSKLVITHSGAGSILTALEQGSKVIAVPRMKKYNEAYDDHQLELPEALSEIGCIKVVYNVDELDDIVPYELPTDLAHKGYERGDIIEFLSSYVRNQKDKR